MLHALGGTVAEGDDAVELLAVGDGVLVGLLLKGQAHPATVQSQRLRQQHQPLAVVADSLVGILGANHGEVVAHAAELAIGERIAATKGLRLVDNQLDMQLALPITRGDLLIETHDNTCLDGLFLILPHRMPCGDGFL